MDENKFENHEEDTKEVNTSGEASSPQEEQSANQTALNETPAGSVQNEAPQNEAQPVQPSDSQVQDIQNENPAQSQETGADVPPAQPQSVQQPAEGANAYEPVEPPRVYRQPQNGNAGTYVGPRNQPTQNGYYNQGAPQGTYYQPSVANSQFAGNPQYGQNAPVQEGTVMQNGENQKPPKKKNSKKAPIIVAIVIAVCVIIGIIAIAVSVSKSGDSGSSSSGGSSQSSDSGKEVTTESSSEVETKDKSGDYTVAGIAKNFKDSCVGITVYTNSQSIGGFDFYGNSSDDSSSSGGSQESGEGSGIIMKESGGKTYILTCAHVISDGSSFKVTLNNEKSYDATMVGYDSQTDVGVLSINATGLKVAAFGDSDKAVVGEQVVAIGCPGGLEFMNSVTSGYISALDRPVSSQIGYSQKCIQTDTAINPGNSGGALFNMQGQVIGMNSSKIASTEYEGMGFAIPSDTALKNANSIIKNGYVAGRAKIGISYRPITNYSNSSAILSALSQKGYKNAEGTMVINDVSSDSSLSGKVQQYDMIVAVNGKTLTSTDVMTTVLNEKKPGDTITLTVARISNNSISTSKVKCTLIESKGEESTTSASSYFGGE